MKAYVTAVLHRARHVFALRVLLFSGLLYLIAFTYCQLRFWRDPHSAFFRDKTVYKLRYSLEREHEGRHFLSRFNGLEDPGGGGGNPDVEAVKSANDPLLCAGFVTIRRAKDDYFDASVGSMLVGLEKPERRAMYLLSLFGNTEPTAHPAWGQRWLRRVVDRVETYNASAEVMENLKKWEEEKDFQVKGVFDYNYVLRHCISHTTAPYIAVFEDDVIFADGWLAKTLNALYELDTNHNNQGSSSWLYLRLFYTETFQKWTSADFMYRNMPMVFFFAVVTSASLLVALRFLMPSSRAYLDPLTIGVISVITIPAFTGLLYMVGKSNVQPLRGVVSMDYGGCCTQALVFPRTQVEALIEFLDARQRGQTDLMIEDYANEKSLRRFALAPQVVQHVGLKSSRGAAEIHAKSTWAFWFEASNHEQLRSEHEELLQGGIMRSMLESYE